MIFNDFEVDDEDFEVEDGWIDLFLVVTYFELLIDSSVQILNSTVLLKNIITPCSEFIVCFAIRFQFLDDFDGKVSRIKYFITATK